MVPHDSDKLFPKMPNDHSMSSSAMQVASKIAELGVRKNFLNGRFVAHSTLRPLSYLDSEFIEIGTSSQTQICVRCDDLSVWSLAHDRAPWPVNNSYDLFDQAMEMVELMHLDDIEVAGMDDFARLGDNVRDAIRAIDSDSVGSNTFWNEFVWDIRSGDYGNIFDDDDPGG